jgi:hypothetical protein
MAVKAGMNIINLSLGDGLGSWEEVKKKRDYK